MVLTIVEASDKTQWKVPVSNSIMRLVTPLTKPDRRNICLFQVLTQWAFVGVILPIFIWLPESAQYYASKDKDELGKKALQRVNGNVPGYDVEVEYAIIKDTIMEERKQLERDGMVNLSFTELIKSYGECLKRENIVSAVSSMIGPVPCSTKLIALSATNHWSCSSRNFGTTDGCERLTLPGFYQFGC